MKRRPQVRVAKTGWPPNCWTVTWGGATGAHSRDFPTHQQALAYACEMADRGAS